MLCSVQCEGDHASCVEYAAQHLGAERASNFFDAFDERLFAEWKQVAAERPGALVLDRLKTFARTVAWNGRPKDYFLDRIVNDPRARTYELAQDPARAAARERVAGITRALVGLPVLSLMLGSHLPWLAMAAIGTSAGMLRSRRAGRLDPSLAPFAVALVYGLSTLPVWTSGDYRYVLPSTLLMQCVALVWLTGRVSRPPRADGSDPVGLPDSTGSGGRP